MRTELPDPIPAYLSRRKTLLSQLEPLQSRVAIEETDRALFVTDLTIATLGDLLAAIERVAHAGEDDAAMRTAEMAQVKQAFETQVSRALSQRGDEAAMSCFMVAIGVLQSQVTTQVTTQVARVDVLRGMLLQSMGVAWLELMEDLFVQENRKVWFDRLQALFDIGSGELPVVGPILALIKGLAEAYTIRRKQAMDTDAYMLALQSYGDAAYIYLTGALAFCESVERWLAGQPAPTAQEVQARIAAHVQSVVDGTHALSAPPPTT